MNVSEFQNATISVSRAGIGQNTTGGTLRTEKARLSGIVACIQGASGRTVFDYARRGLTVDSTIYVDSIDFQAQTALPGGLKANDLITDDSGNTYIVQGFNRLEQDQIFDGPCFAIHALSKIV